MLIFKCDLCGKEYDRTLWQPNIISLFSASNDIKGLTPAKLNDIKGLTPAKLRLEICHTCFDKQVAFYIERQNNILEGHNER